ncbi:hypothetical protein CASFOL_022783 [Castilleja foliolosa]|uniref:Uncharacterized protein n=1 Tax=Castilleja foliolosa TaxID=1961234 RepID=A0ABD3CVB6_9LAMI
MEAPPCGWWSFSYDQYLSGLIFSLPPFLRSVSSAYEIPPNRWHSNAIRYISTFFILLSARDVRPTVPRFQSLFQFRKLLESLEVSPMDEEWHSVLNADWDRATSSSDSDSSALSGRSSKRGRN